MSDDSDKWEAWLKAVEHLDPDAVDQMRVMADKAKADAYAAAVKAEIEADEALEREREWAERKRRIQTMTALAELRRGVTIH